MNPIFATLVAFVISLAPVCSMAGVFVKPVLSYSLDDNDDGSITSISSRQMLDMSVGYVFDLGLIVFAHHGTEQRNNSSWQKYYNPYPPYQLLTRETNSKESRTSIGAGLGWKSGKGNDTGFFVMGMFFPNNENSVSGTVYKGTGYQADAGVSIATGKVNVALQISFRSFTYTTTDQGTPFEDPIGQKNLDPGIGVYVGF